MDTSRIKATAAGSVNLAVETIDVGISIPNKKEGWFEEKVRR